MSKYITNFSRGCFHHWTESKACMEFVSNWLDSDGEREHEFTGDSLVLINKNIKVSNKMLMMGLSDKRQDNSKRGQFGVGSVQALVVLTDLGYNVSIINNDVVWDARFEHSNDFDEDILVIDETPNYNSQDFIVTVSGLSEDILNEVKERCLEFQDREVLHSTPMGDVISSNGEEGEVFCGGMYVCQSANFKYNYDFKPKQLPLNQDRNSVDNWKLQELTAKMIIGTEDDDFIKEAIEDNNLDTNHIQYGWACTTPGSLDDSFAGEFIDNNPEAIITSDYEEHQQQEELGNKSVYEPNKVKAKIIQDSCLYQDHVNSFEIVERDTDEELITKFIDNTLELLYNESLLGEGQHLTEVQKNNQHLIELADAIKLRMEKDGINF